MKKSTTYLIKHLTMVGVVICALFIVPVFRGNAKVSHLNRYMVNESRLREIIQADQPIRPPGADSKLVIAFYAGEWGTPEVDGNWSGWNRATRRWERPVCKPPESYPGVHLPASGLYSSHNESVLAQQLQDMREAGVNAVMMNFGGSLNTTHTQKSFEIMLKVAPKYNISLFPGFGPYNEFGLNASVAFADVAFFKATYANDPGIFRLDGHPVVFFWNTNDFPASSDMRDFFPGYVLIGGSKERGELDGLFEAEYDGFSGWLPSHINNWAADDSNWGTLRKVTEARHMLFVPAVSPGYNDTIVDRWSRIEMVSRHCGEYYDRRWKTAIESGADMVIINSWNNYPEGSNIEPVNVGGENNSTPVNNEVWCGTDPYFYVKRTRYWVDLWRAGI